MENSTTQTRGSTVDQRERQPADLRSVPCHSVTAQTGGSAVVPHLHGCSVGGNFTLNVSIQSDNRGVENRGDTAWMKQLQDAPLGAGASGSDDITGSESEGMQEPASHLRNGTRTGLGGTQSDAPFLQRERKPKEFIIKDQQTLKSDLKRKFVDIFNGLGKDDHPIPLNEIYTELYITEGGNWGVNTEHEVQQIETAFKRQTSQETAITCNDIFKPLPGQRHTIRTVLTKGIAGIGKTISVQKFILDWAEGKANQDIDFIFTLPFRDLNLKKGEKFSLMELLQHYFPRLTFHKHLSLEEIKSLDCEAKVLFIFDGLDECRLPLDFQKNEMWFDVTKTIAVEKLLTNLILGHLLPSALLWITSRPAAASQIPSKCIHQMTEVRGFNDPQKEEYFRKRFRDQTLAGRVISHIKESRSLFIMCHIPVVCWISAAVLESVFGRAGTKKAPKSLTEMYTHFLISQTYVKNEKYQGTNRNEINPENMSTSDVEIILKLGKLAFINLKRGNLIFYEKDLRKCEIDVTEASVYSGVCTQIFKEEAGYYRKKVYCFVHLSIQEYFAALFVFHSFVTGNINLLKPDSTEDQEEDEEDTDATAEGDRDEFHRMPLFALHRSAVDEALKSANGHLDLFLRFLLGLSLESTQELLQDLLTQTGRRSGLVAGLRNMTKNQNNVHDQALLENTSHVSETRNTSLGIKKIINKFRDFGRNSLRMLGGSSRARNSARKKRRTFQARDVVRETTEKTIVQYIKEKIREERVTERVLNLFHCLYELNENSLVEEIQTSLRSGKLSNVELEPGQCSTVAFVLLMSEKVLEVFDLKAYNTSVSGRLRLLTVVRNCRRAMLSYCNLPAVSMAIVASALDSSPLVDLNLSNNNLGDSGLELLCAGLTQSCKLQALDLSNNDFGDSGVKLLCAGLSQNCELQALDLSNNDFGDSGVKLLCAGLKNPNCKLQTLRLSGCQVTERGCAYLASALHSNPSHLRELDLSYNHPGESGVIELSAGLEDPSWRLEKLNVDHGGQIRLIRGLRKYACQLTLDPKMAHRELSLSEGNRKVTHSVEKEEPCPDHTERFDSYHQVLCREGLTGRCYWEVEWRKGEPKNKEGWTAVGVAYKGISRKVLVSGSYLGGNDKSWSLELDNFRYFSRHDMKCSPIFKSSGRTSRVGVYLDWPAGTLSFYSISSDTLTPLHIFHTTFTEPVYPGFRVRAGFTLSLL